MNLSPALGYAGAYLRIALENVKLVERLRYDDWIAEGFATSVRDWEHPGIARVTLPGDERTIPVMAERSRLNFAPGVKHVRPWTTLEIEGDRA